MYEETKGKSSGSEEYKDQVKSPKVSKERESGMKLGEGEVRDERSAIQFEVNERWQSEVEELGS